MKTSKPILFVVALICFALLGFALYLQHVKFMQPCPLCIIQRYAFAVVGIICLVFAILPRGAIKIGSYLGVLAALGGAGTAGWHLWVKAHPTVSCGIDPLETALNKLPTTQWLPQVFKADGMCTTEYEPIFGLSIPQWSLVWFVILIVVLLWAAGRQQRR
jgi:disulfide bond formation protein DsbB